MTKKSDFIYLRELIQAGWTGVASVHNKSARVPLTPAAIGASLGLLSAGMRYRRASKSSMAMAAFVGSAVGLGAGAAWPKVRAAMQQINTARDLHWLETHPITYA